MCIEVAGIQVAAEPDLAALLSELVDNSDGQEIYLRRPERYGLASSTPTNFAHVSPLHAHLLSSWFSQAYGCSVMTCECALHRACPQHMLLEGCYNCTVLTCPVDHVANPIIAVQSSPPSVMNPCQGLCMHRMHVCFEQVGSWHASQ